MSAKEIVQFVSKTLRPVRRLLPALLFLSSITVFQAQKEDYLNDQEIEQLREAQEPPQRVKLLEEFLKERLDKARALKSPVSLKEKERKPVPEKVKNAPSQSKGAASQVPSNKTAEKPTEKSFAVLMGEYLRCLEEISSNIENFSSFKVEPKAYLKSLKSLNQSLEEHRKWIAEISGQLGRSEKPIVSEVSEVLEELSSDLNASIQRASEQLRELKESKKGKSSPR